MEDIKDLTILMMGLLLVFFGAALVRSGKKSSASIDALRLSMFSPVDTVYITIDGSDTSEVRSSYFNSATSEYSPAHSNSVGADDPCNKSPEPVTIGSGCILVGSSYAFPRGTLPDTTYFLYLESGVAFLSSYDPLTTSAHRDSACTSLVSGEVVFGEDADISIRVGNKCIITQPLRDAYGELLNEQVVYNFGDTIYFTQDSLGVLFDGGMRYFIEDSVPVYDTMDTLHFAPQCYPSVFKCGMRGYSDDCIKVKKVY